MKKKDLRKRLRQAIEQGEESFAASGNLRKINDRQYRELLQLKQQLTEQSGAFAVERATLTAAKADLAARLNEALDLARQRAAEVESMRKTVGDDHRALIPPAGVDPERSGELLGDAEHGTVTATGPVTLVYDDQEWMVHARLSCRMVDASFPDDPGATRVGRWGGKLWALHGGYPALAMAEALLRLPGGRESRVRLSAPACSATGDPESWVVQGLGYPPFVEPQLGGLLAEASDD